MSCRIIISSVLLTLTLFAKGQHQYDQWLFYPDNFGIDDSIVGLDFRSFPPKVITDINPEGRYVFYQPSVLCDRESGKLLFYSDSYSLWGLDHKRVQGSKSENRYYGSLFLESTVDKSIAWYLKAKNMTFTSNNLPIRYYKIDKSLNNGIGAISGSLGLFERNTHTDLTATPYSDGKGYWIASRGDWSENDSIFLYRFEEGYVDKSVKAYYGQRSAYGFAQMSFSPDASMLACPGELLYKFDNQSGALSEPLSLRKIFEHPRYDSFRCTMVEKCFSPDSRYLYVLENMNHDNGSDKRSYFVQYDLAVWDADSIIASRVELGVRDVVRYIRGIQLGPDGKIYVIQEDPEIDKMEWLGVLEFPNRKAPACSFKPQGLYLEGMSCYGQLCVLRCSRIQNKIKFFEYEQQTVIEMRGSWIFFHEGLSAGVYRQISQTALWGLPFTGWS